MGGNKLRKLEYIVPDAIASNADTLVSIGGVQSNHTRMVAATAAKIGMKCVVIQESWVPHEDAVYDRVGNILLTRLMGADSRIVPDGFDIGIRKSWEDAIQSVKDAGGKPYPIPAGASVHKYGGLGYVGFAEEVRAQEKQIGVAFDYIIVCVVTGSTQAGMIVGFAADNRAHRVIGIDGSGTPQQVRAQVRDIVDNTAELVELGRAVRDDEIVILEDYAYPAYGVPSRETNEAIRFAARTEVMITDPVYEGKSMQGMIHLVKEGLLSRRLQGALRPSRRRTRDQRLQLHLSQWLVASRPDFSSSQYARAPGGKFQGDTLARRRCRWWPWLRPDFPVGTGNRPAHANLKRFGGSLDRRAMLAHQPLYSVGIDVEVFHETCILVVVLAHEVGELLGGAADWILRLVGEAFP